MSQLSIKQTQIPSSWNYADADTTFRMCCITVGNSPSFNTATVFDNDAHTSFVNRELAAWIQDALSRAAGEG